MSARTVLVASIPILLAGLLPAQVEPLVARSLDPRPNWLPPAAYRLANVTIQNTGGGSDFVGVSFQQTMNSPHSLRAFDYNSSTNTITPRTDFNSISLDAQELAISPDLRTLVVNVIGVGTRALQRASSTAPWGSPTPIQGLTSNEYGLQFCRLNGVLCLLACTQPPNSHIVVYPFLAATLSVGSPVAILFPPLGNRNNFLAFATALDDDLGNTRGFVACIRQPLGFQQQFVFTGGTDGTAPWMVWFNTPLHSFFVGGDQLRGGHIVAVNSGLPIGTVPNGAIDVVGMFMFHSNAPVTGGWTDFTAMGPAGDLAVIGIATALKAPIQLPGFVNRFGLDPALMFGTFVQSMPNGVARIPLFLPATTAGVYPLQSLALGAPGFPNVFGNTEALELH